MLAAWLLQHKVKGKKTQKTLNVKLWFIVKKKKIYTPALTSTEVHKNFTEAKKRLCIQCTQNKAKQLSPEIRQLHCYEISKIPC